MASSRGMCVSRLSGVPAAPSNSVVYADGENPACSAIYEKLDQHLLCATLDGLYSKGDDVYEKIATYRDPDSIRLAIGADEILRTVVELVEKENLYVAYLKRVKDGFMLPLTPFLSVAQRLSVFNNLEDLIRVHSEFYEEIWEAFNRRHEHLGDSDNSISVPGVPAACLRSIHEAIMKRRSDFARVYAVHLEGLRRSVEALAEVQKSTDGLAKEQIRECEMDQPDGDVPLVERVRCPAQRFMKLACLIEAIVKALGEEHEEHGRLKEALGGLMDVNSYLDAVFREAGEINAGRFLKALLKFDGLASTGEAITIRYHLFHKGELEVTAKDIPRGVKCCVVLGDNLLICRTMETGELDCLHVVPLADRYVETRGSCLVWNIISQITMEEVTFFCKTEKERVEWVDAVNRAITMAQRNAQPTFLRLNGHRYSSTACGSGSMCAICDTFLTGFDGRGLECSVCDRRAHPECIMKSPSVDSPCAAPEPPTLRSHDAVQQEMVAMISTKIWFEADLMDRYVIERCLGSPSVPNGTFFARFSSTLGPGSIVFSVKVDGVVKNLRVMTVRRNDGGRPCIAYCVSEWIGFDSLDNLVTWCLSNPLLVSDERGKPRGCVQFGIPYRVLPHLTASNGSSSVVDNSSPIHRRSQSEPTSFSPRRTSKKRHSFFTRSTK